MNKELLLTIVAISLLCIAAPVFGQQVQAVHGAADPFLSSVDVYVSIGPIPVVTIQDIDFRAANPILTSPFSGLTLDFGIAPGDSEDSDDILVSFSVFLEADKVYFGAFRGVVDPGGFLPNPEGLSTGLDVTIIDNGRTSSASPGNVQFTIAHTVTDAGALDFKLADGTVLASDVSYGDFSDYATITPGVHTVEVVDAVTSSILCSFSADLSDYADSSFVMLASGFENPAMNQNGEPFGLHAIFPSADSIEFDKIVGIEDGVETAVKTFELHQNFPNPFNPTTTISYQLPTSAQVNLTVFDILGHPVKQLAAGTMQAAGQHSVVWDATNDFGNPLPSGVYFYRLTADPQGATANGFTQTRKMMLVR